MRNFDLTLNKYLKKVYYEDSDVIHLESMRWVARIRDVGLLNMLWVSYFNHTNLNTIFVHQQLTLVCDWCLWLGEPIPITDMLIYHIMLLPSQRVDPMEAFVGNSQEKKLVDQMKRKFGLVKKSGGYSIHSISNGVV